MSASVKDMLGEAHALLLQANDIVTSPDYTDADRERVESLENEAKEIRERAGRMARIEEARADLEAKIRQDGEVEPTNEEPGAFKTIGEQLIAVAKSRQGIYDPRLRAFYDSGEPGEKDLSGASGASGAFLMEPQHVRTIYAAVVEQNRIAALSTRIPMASRSVFIPALKQSGTASGEPNWFGGMAAFWTEEGGEKTSTQPEFREIELIARKLAAFTRSSDELLMDSAQSLEAFLTGPMGFPGIVAWKLEYAYLRGTGAGQPLGVLNAPTTVSVGRANDVPPVQYIDLVNMLEHFLPSTKGEWFIGQSLISSLMTMKDDADHFLWPTLFQGGASAGKPANLLGMPVNYTEKLPFAGQAGDILLADFSYYLVGDRQAITIQSTNVEKFIEDKTTWRVVYRGDGKPWLDAPITLADGQTTISPFVILGAKAS